LDSTKVLNVNVSPTSSNRSQQFTPLLTSHVKIPSPSSAVSSPAGYCAKKGTPVKESSHRSKQFTPSLTSHVDIVSPSNAVSSPSGKGGRKGTPVKESVSSSNRSKQSTPSLTSHVDVPSPSCSVSSPVGKGRKKGTPIKESFQKKCHRNGSWLGGTPKRVGQFVALFGSQFGSHSTSRTISRRGQKLNPTLQKLDPENIERKFVENDGSAQIARLAKIV